MMCLVLNDSLCCTMVKQCEDGVTLDAVARVIQKPTQCAVITRQGAKAVRWCIDNEIR